MREGKSKDENHLEMKKLHKGLRMEIYSPK